MGKLTNIILGSALFLGLTISCVEFNQKNKNTYNIKVLDKTKYQTLFGKVREEYAVKIKNENGDRVDLFNNNNVLFYKRDASEISEKLKIGGRYFVTVNSLLFPPPNIVSVEDAK